MDFRALRKGDDRSQFACGVPALDTFFRRYVTVHCTPSAAVVTAG